MKTQTKALTIAIAPKTIVYLDASSSPQRAHVVSVSADKVTYVTYPYYDLRQEDIRIFRHLAQVGTQTQTDYLTAMKEAKGRGDKFAFYTDYLDKLRDELANLLDGVITTEHDYTQDQRIRVYLLPDEDNANADHWSYIESQGFEVSGQDLRSGQYEIFAARSDLQSLRNLTGYKLVSFCEFHWL